ncbi:thiamine-phosphate kinase [Tessaracoccus flavus]|uniref:Thiamine-monophosphate kinase n=1 Tax=Tessaracoccus flavus TaxID=1610493 RepID=A0A1Q2CER8_9ACTN|nr:thiamine-phosphate kinase [Tessaracoccus flavus]AQP44614.1 thiamine-phosphate kinase [Tessaracoccus flavus]SDZ08373.1 thiamine-phosphate kinase [Tessaracoccus flavus]
MSSEFELIDTITAGVVVGDDVVVPVGDDAAVLSLAGHTVVTTDMLIENVHFKRQWSSARSIGRKAIAVNVSDLEAMGARPSSVVIALAFPKDLDQQWVVDFEAGAKEECVAAGVSLVGGDLSSSAHVAICVTAIGDMEGTAPVTRAGARPGDVVAVCGKLGWASAGLVVLQRGFGSPKDVVAEQLTPSVPYGQGIAAARAGATAMLDVSDGLLGDLAHIAESSQVLIDVDTALIEIPEQVQRVAAATGKPPLGFVLAGGEDHALAATFPPGAPLPVGWRRVGTVAEGSGVTVDGQPWDGSLGWDHFG